jgi:hypothetical protein
MNFDRILSILTFAGVAGLVILNANGASEIIKALSGAANSYVATVQGR